MIPIIWKRLLHRKVVTLTVILAFISLYVLIPFGLQQTKVTKTTVSETIEDFGRGTYDILVRPSNSRTQIEQTFGMVEENYIGDGNGGISINEWKDIQANPDIEVAAPVSSLGYFRGKQFSIELPVLKKPTRFTIQFYTSDGQKKYPIDDRKSITYFKQSRPGLIQYLTQPENGRLSSAAMMVMIPPSYYLLAAIDPDSEHKLTGIDFSELKGKHETKMLKSILDNYGNPPVIKVLQRKDLSIPLTMRLKTETLDIMLTDYLNKLDLKSDEWLMQGGSTKKIKSALQDLENEKVIKSDTIYVDLSQFQNPFDGTAIKLSKNLKPKIAERYMSEFNTSVYYTASRINYQNLESTPAVNIIKEGEPPSYKKVEKKGASMESTFDIPFFLEQVGAFSPSTKSNNKLAGSPLGIYGGMKAKTLDGEVLTTTTIPGSFIPAPASGVTTLKAAELIKGDEPIDAIRIRVAGINEYNKNAQRKISEVATKLLKKGYEVDVVAGSSFKKMALDVEGIGKVVEPWVTLGVAQELSTTWNYVTLLTTGLFITFGALWLIVRLNYEKNILSNENQLLHTIGWRNSKVKIRNCIEQYILITISLLISLILLGIFGATGYMFWVTFSLWIFSLLAVTFLLMRKTKATYKAKIHNRFSSIFYYWNLIFPAMMILFFVSLLIVIQLSSIGSTIQNTSVTSLGEFTNSQTIRLQTFVVLFTFILGIFSVTECLNSLLIERKNEFNMYWTIGWTKGMILKRITRETTAWALLPVLSGTLIGAFLLYLLNVKITWIGIGVGTTFLLLVITVYIVVLTRRIKY